MSILDEIVEAIGPIQSDGEPSAAAVELAKENNAAIVYAYADDLTVFYGAVYGDYQLLENNVMPIDNEGVIYMNRKGEFEDSHYGLTVEQARVLCNRFDNSVKIKAVLSDLSKNSTGVSWVWAYELPSNIPHATFEVMEDDELYCRGVVFQLPAKLEGSTNG